MWGGPGVVVLAAATGLDGYDARPILDEQQWATLLSNLDRLADIVAARGLTAVLHPHVGTMVESRSEVDRVLTGSTIPLCLDTGHLLIGGTDPLALTKEVPERIKHAHLKDVDAALALARTAAEADLGRVDIAIAGAPILQKSFNKRAIHANARMRSVIN